MLLEFPASKSNIPETAQQQQQQEADRLRLSSYYVTAWNSPLRDNRSSLHSFHHFWSASMQVAVHVLAWLGGIAPGQVVLDVGSVKTMLALSRGGFQVNKSTFGR